MRTKILVFTSFVLLSLYSCRSVKLVPEYNEAIENQLIENQKQNEKIYTDLLAKTESDRTFESCEKQYLEIESNINSILFQYQAAEKSENFIAMAQLLKDNFKQYKQEHKIKKTLTDGDIEGYVIYINGFWQPILKAQKAIKNIKT